MTYIQSIHIGILRYPNAQEATILGLRDLFIIANQIGQTIKEQSLPQLKVSIINLEDTINYADIAFLQSYTQEKCFSALIIPPDLSGIPKISTDDRYIKFLRLHYKKGTILASVCTGAFLLANTGLLTNRHVTTHWKYGNILKIFFPEILLQIDKLLVDDKDIITTSGGMCWADMGLCLINRLLGPTVMAETSKMCLLQPYRREQRHYSIFEPQMDHEDNNILKVQRWIETAKIKEPITLKTLSKISKLKIRTLQRRFVKATGLNITEYVQRYRVKQSQVFLQYTDMSVKQIAHNVGYNDDNAFSKVFIKIVGLKPNVYRQAFSVL